MCLYFFHFLNKFYIFANITYMLVFRNKADIKIEYPITNFSNKDKILFFDIETTGFSRKYCIVYLIGCMYYSGNELYYTQWLAENFNDEANVLMAFHKFIKDFDTIIHFNGNSFDIPFVTERGNKYNLDFNFDNFQSIDIYKPVSKLNHLLKMENNKQKSFEKLLNIKREDIFSGGDLIELFKQYVESKDERLLFPLLLHNKEDVWNMGLLCNLISITDIFEYKYNVESFKIHDFKSYQGDICQELCITATLHNPVPINISHNTNGFYFKVEDTRLILTVPVCNGTFKYFFNNYKDYYFLPLEDRAIHKSIGEYMDKKFRKAATASTCYEKFSGSFLPIFDTETVSFNEHFKLEHKDKISYIKSNALNNENIYEYSKIILDYIRQTK